MQPEPAATYRLQLHPGFGFKEALQIIKYLADLGVTHLYTSPYLQAVLNSMHGYDVVDPTKINSQLGTSEEHQFFCESVRGAGLGLMIDVVPNHMAIAGKQNPWWWDVLENGPSSPFATYFDVDWSASEERWPNKVLLPVLGDQYGRVLDRGELQLSFEEGRFVLYYHDKCFPLDPSSLAPLISRVAAVCHSELLAFIAQSHARLPRPTVTSRKEVEHRHRDKEVLFNLLSSLLLEKPEIADVLQAEIERLNHDPDGLDALIESQNYRLALWSTANRDLGYRRFFDIKDLAGLRIEDFNVFRATHDLPIQWFKKGWIQGVRVDHPDGLRNPEQYFSRLQQVCPTVWVVAEKILERGEKLPSNWKVDGTTGYDFLNGVERLFIDCEAKEPMTQIYHEIIGRKVSFPTLVHQCKYLVLKELFGSEVERLTTLFIEICDRHRRHRDYTRTELSEALCQTGAFFSVYRTYNGPDPAEDRVVDQAIDLAIKERPDLDPELFYFLKKLLLFQIPGELEGELAARFQQLTGPVMAKGYEDTALYRYNRFIALNEVGGDPDCFGISLKQFHEILADGRPLSLLASTTHDTKRSEDCRARLAVLSEMPEEWGQVVKGWMKKKSFTDKNLAYFFYQTLVGAWPIDEGRMREHLIKVMREAKEYTSWTKPNKAYEESVNQFVTSVMQDQPFLVDVERFVNRLLYPGRVNSLAQTLIKLTAPGVADIYQGSELWNLTLVDPDNRKEVDFNLRRQLLAEMEQLSLQAIVERMDEGLPKLWLIRQVLHLRKEKPHLFRGGYQALFAEGKKSDHVVAFLRGESVLTVAPRLGMRLNNGWEETQLDLPKGLWHNVLTGEKMEGGRVDLSLLLGGFPVALLCTDWYP